MKAVILAGGLGRRLRPFTEIIPKPLLPLGEKALLEVQIEHLRVHGFDEIILATNYRSDYVRAFLGDGGKYGVALTFSQEKAPLGTCGPLSLLREKLTDPFLVMNGDILTKADLSKIYRFSLKDFEAELTIVTKMILSPFRFGNVLTKGDYVLDIQEKPDLKFEVLAGVYVMKPGILEFVPDNTYYGMDDLIRELLAEKRKILRYVLTEYWIDIGQVDDYDEAVQVYKDTFRKDHAHSG